MIFAARAESRRIGVPDFLSILHPTDRLVVCHRATNGKRTKHMTNAMGYHSTASCACGRVSLGLIGAPIMTVACYCDDCQEAARRIESVPGAPPVKATDGGTPYLVYRKDRLEVAAGREYLLADKLHPASVTHRVVPLVATPPCIWASMTASTGSISTDRASRESRRRLRCGSARGLLPARRMFPAMCRVTLATPSASSRGCWQRGSQWPCRSGGEPE